MADVYDCAHRLAKALRHSDEHQAYLDAQKKIHGDERSIKLINQYRQKQMELHAKQLAGETLTDDDHQSVSQLREVLELKPEIREFLQCEARLIQLMSDIQGILSESVDLDFE